MGAIVSERLFCDPSERWDKAGVGSDRTLKALLSLFVLPKLLMKTRELIVRLWTLRSAVDRVLKISARLPPLIGDSCVCATGTIEAIAELSDELWISPGGLCGIHA